MSCSLSVLSRNSSNPQWWVFRNSESHIRGDSSRLGLWKSEDVLLIYYFVSLCCFGNFLMFQTSCHVQIKLCMKQTFLLFFSLSLFLCSSYTFSFVSLYFFYSFSILLLPLLPLFYSSSQESSLHLFFFLIPQNNEVCSSFLFVFQIRFNCLINNL